MAIFAVCFVILFLVLEFLAGNKIFFLIQRLNDREFPVRAEAEEALAGMGKPAVGPLISALSDEDLNIRRGAARVLGKIKDVRAAEPLLEALKDQDSALQFWAARSLAQMGTPGVESLIRALESGYPGALEAVKVLGEMKDERAVMPLIASLKNGDRILQKEATRALGKIKDPSSVEPLISILKDKEEKVWLRVYAARALSEIGDERALEALKALAADEDEDWVVRNWAKPDLLLREMTRRRRSRP